MKQKNRTLSLGFALLCLPFLPCNAGAQNGRHGAQVFKKCAVCHMIDSGRNRVGPSLQGILGRQAGTHEGYPKPYRYSPAMVKVGQEGLIWNRQIMEKYLHNPQSVVRGTRMAPVRLSDEDITSLLDYIEEISKKSK